MTDEEIDIAAMEYADEYDNSLEYCAARDAFIAGAKWAEGQMKTQSLSALNNRLMDKKEKRKIVDSIVPKCTADAKCEDRHNKHGDFVFELRQIISAHRWEDEWGVGINDEEGMARKIIGLVLDNIPDNFGPN